MLRNTFACAAVGAAFLTAPASGQSRQIPAPAQQQPIVIHDATVHPVTADVIERGYVVFDEGVIIDVGAGDAPDVANAVRLDGSGLHVYPGLINPVTALGLIETGAVDVTIDHTEYGRFTPEVRAAVAVNPDSDLIPVARANGILTAMSLPRGGLVAGRASVLRLDGWTWEEMAIDDTAGLVVNWPRTEPITAWWMNKTDAEQRKEIADDLRNIERIFDEAAAYLKAKDANDEVPTDLRYEAMRAAMEGTKPIFVNAASAGQIESAVAWGLRRGLKIVIVGGNGADQVLPLLAEHDVPVIIGSLHRLPGRRDMEYDQPFSLPARLGEAGVRFCIAGGNQTGSERNLNHNAATSVAYGLPADHALRAVTIDSADILGLGASHGALETGRAATLIVTNGDPLEIMTDTLVAFIDGRRIDLGNRQKSLSEKYREKYRQLGLIE